MLFPCLLRKGSAEIVWIDVLALKVTATAVEKVGHKSLLPTAYRCDLKALSTSSPEMKSRPFTACLVGSLSWLSAVHFSILLLPHFSLKQGHERFVTIS